MTPLILSLTRALEELELGKYVTPKALGYMIGADNLHRLVMELCHHGLLTKCNLITDSVKVDELAKCLNLMVQDENYYANF